jgi:hypothetical protein
MARAKDLAALAGLAGIGYMLSKKGDKAGADTGGDSNPTRGAGYNSTETRLKTPAQSIADADKSSKADSIVDKGPSGTTTPGPAPAPNLDVKPAPAPVKPSNVVTGNDLPPATPLKTITRNYKDPEKQKVYDTLNEKSGANTSSAQRSDQLQDLSRAVNREAKTSKAAQGDFSDVTRTYTNQDDTPAVKHQEMYDTLNKKSGANTSSARKTDALAVASRAARAADAKRRAAKASGYKSGGTVSSVSKRADGIATKGKTRGKIC